MVAAEEAQAPIAPPPAANQPDQITTEVFNQQELQAKELA